MQEYQNAYFGRQYKDADVIHEGKYMHTCIYVYMHVHGCKECIQLAHECVCVCVI